MPELPEVEAYRRRVEPEILGTQVTGTWEGKEKFRRTTNLESEKLVGKKCLGIDRYGKWLILRFTSNQNLFVHLGMSGRLEVRKLQFVPIQHDHLALLLTGGLALVFNDRRRFGTFRTVPPSGLGPDALTAKFSAEWVSHVAANSQASIATLLLDQSLVAGLGTIYVSESLHDARLKPSRRLSALSQADVSQFVSSVRKVLRKAIRVGGTTLKDYRGTANELGNYEQYLNVYGSLGGSCSRCGKKEQDRLCLV